MTFMRGLILFYVICGVIMMITKEPALAMVFGALVIWFTVGEILDYFKKKKEAEGVWEDPWKGY